MTGVFELDGTEFVALNGGPRLRCTEAMSFVVNCETQQKIDFTALQPRLRSDLTGVPTPVSYCDSRLRRASQKRSIC
jgi:predicted 3-demethylubiquinone-9 3-methyltransferase (glyoxalase superfamily)